MYSRAKMEVDFLFCTNLLDFSPEKVLKSVENTFMLK